MLMAQDKLAFRHNQCGSKDPSLANDGSYRFPMSRDGRRRSAVLITVVGKCLGSEGRVPRVPDRLRKWGLVELVLPSVVLIRCQNENCWTQTGSDGASPWI